MLTAYKPNLYPSPIEVGDIFVPRYISVQKQLFLGIPAVQLTDKTDIRT